MVYLLPAGPLLTPFHSLASHACSFTQVELLARYLQTAMEAAATAAEAATAAARSGSGGGAPPRRGTPPPLELALRLAPGERLILGDGRVFGAGSVAAGALRTMEVGLQARAQAYPGGGLKVSLGVGHVD